MSSELDLLVSNLCKLFKAKGFVCLELPLIVNNAIRYDLTSAIAAPNDVTMCYKHGVVFRLERHCDLGRFRQFVQFDFDVFGLCCSLNDFWLVCWVYELMCLLSCVCYVKCVLNTKRLLLGLSEVMGVLCYPVKRTKLLRVLDKSAALTYKELLCLLGAGRFDASGAFVPGLGMSPEFASSKLDAMCSKASTKQHHSNFRLNSAFTLLRQSRFGEFGVRELLYYDSALLVCGLLESFVVLKPLFNRGLEYYTGVIFEVVSEVVLLSERNVFVRIGSLAGGGRFDYYARHITAIGCSLGLSRSLTFLSCVRRAFTRSAPRSVCVCSSLDGGCELAWLSRELIKLGVSVKLVSGLSFASALKVASESDALLLRSSGGWVVKSTLKRRYLRFRVLDSVLWRSLFIDQFWVNDNGLLSSVLSLLNSVRCYVRV